MKVAIEHADCYRLSVVKSTLRKIFDDLGYPEKNPLFGGGLCNLEILFL